MHALLSLLAGAGLATAGERQTQLLAVLASFFSFNG